MESTSALPSLSKMAKIRSNNLGVSILFPVGENGMATITALYISIRFGLQDISVWVEYEVYDPITLALLHTMSEASKHSNDGTFIWTLKPSKYRIYSLTTSQMSNPTQFVIPRQSSSCTIIPPTVQVKIERGVQAIIDLSESFEDDVFLPPPPIMSPILGAPHLHTLDCPHCISQP